MGHGRQPNNVVFLHLQEHGLRFVFRVFSFFALITAFSAALAAATIKGIVKDDRKNVVPAVTVILKENGASTSTITDIGGKFSLQVPDDLESVVLIFKREGFHPKERRVTVDNQFKIIKLFFISTEYDLQKVTVTAMNRQKKTVAVPMAEHSVSQLEIREKISENIVDTLSDTPGVHFIGSGGFSVTPTIRGLARRRVLVMVDGSRVTSDRRAGTSASFVPPELAERIEVVRSSSSVLYGSDAIAGVVNIMTRSGAALDKPKWEENSINLNFNSSSKRINAGFTYGLMPGKWHIFSGFQFSHAGNYESPEETVVFSDYTYYSGLLDISFSDEKREFFLGYIAGFGKDIGKPDRENNPRKYTVVPSESDQFLRLGYIEKGLFNNGSLQFSLFLNPTTYLLDKVNLDKDSREGSDTRAFNLGVKTVVKKTLSRAFKYQAGVEWFSRQDVRISNENENLEDHSIVASQPMRSGTRDDYSLFFAVDYLGIRSFEIDAGFRYTFFSIDAESDEAYKEKSTDSYSFFLGVTRRLSDSVSLFCNVGRAFRFPSLGESFYSGLTGRRYVIGNPGLEPESSFNIDAGLKVASKQFTMGLYFFTHRIDNMIERYRGKDDIYTYDNINRGTIMGGEIEARYRPVTSVDIFGHFFYYRGRSTASKDNDPLNDVPAPRLLLGGRFFADRLWFEFNFQHSFKKSDPGPAEVKNNAYSLLDLKGGYYFTSTFYLFLKIANALNAIYFPNPDPDIPPAKGFNVSAGIHFYF
jgi:outer membrane receptor protein involved in Fe transport